LFGRQFVKQRAAYDGGSRGRLRRYRVISPVMRPRGRNSPGTGDR
jgi:hypothetical protein